MVVGCVIFFNDGPALLERCLASLRLVTDRIFAIDGPFAEFPHKSIRSSEENLQVVRKYTQFILGCPFPQGWPDQATKRNAYISNDEFALKEGDYIFTLDADEQVEGKKIQYLRSDFYKVQILTHVSNMDLKNETCRLMKYRTGLFYSRRHNVINTPDDKLVNLGEPKGLPLWSSVIIKHFPAERGAARLAEDAEYMNNRAENTAPMPSVGPATSDPKPSLADDKVTIPLECLHPYRGFTNEGQQISLVTGEKMRFSPITAARLLADFPKWFKEGE